MAIINNIDDAPISVVFQRGEDMHTWGFRQEKGGSSPVRHLLLAIKILCISKHPHLLLLTYLMSVSSRGGPDCIRTLKVWVMVSILQGSTRLHQNPEGVGHGQYPPEVDQTASEPWRCGSWSVSSRGLQDYIRTLKVWVMVSILQGSTRLHQNPERCGSWSVFSWLATLPASGYHIDRWGKYVGHYAMVAGISHDIAFRIYHLGCKGIPHDHVVWILAMSYAFHNHRKLQFGIFNSQKWLKPWNKKITKCLVSCGTGGHLTHGVWLPYTTQSFGFMLTPKALITIELTVVFKYIQNTLLNVTHMPL